MQDGPTLKLTPVKNKSNSTPFKRTMKTTHLNRLLTALIAGTALLATLSSHAATPLDDTVNFTNSFDNAASVTSWIYWYGNGSNNNAMTWDATMDAGNNPNSGSLLFETTFPSSDQLAWFGTFGNRWAYDTEFRHDATKYTNIVMDIHVDPSSAISQAGTFGDLQIGFYDGPNQIGSQTIPASATNGWAHIVQPIDPSTPSISSVSGIAFRIQTYNNFANPIGHVKFWIDNLKMIVSPVKIPPPTLGRSFNKATQGLNMLSTAANGNEFQRTSILYNNHFGVGWLGSPDSVTYSLTITNFPSGIYTNYQGHIFITTGNTPPSFETSPDYSETNVVFFDVHQNFDGTGTAYFRYKVNEENQNSNMFGLEYIGLASAGTLTNVHASTVLGTWGITFSQDTNVTIFGPGGASTSFTFRPVAAANFVEPLNVLFGGQPNRQSDANPLVNIGQDVVISAVGITNGSTTVLSDNFMADSTLDTTSFTRLAGDVNTVQLVPADSAFWIRWSLPDVGFGLQTTTNIVDPSSWTTITGPSAGGQSLNNYTTTGSRFTLVPRSALGSPNADYFRLIDESFKKLQVLLPGETAAPGTATGKTGTPTSVSAGATIQVVVNAVNSQWFVINTVTDTVHITSTDTGAFIDPDAALLQGSQVFNVTFSAPGTYTVTASDLTDATKSAGTSASIVVTP